MEHFTVKVKISINPVLDMETLTWVTPAERIYEMEESEIPLRFDRSQQKAGKTATANETNTAGTFGGEAQSIGGPLVSQLQKQAANPTGFNPTDVNNMLVAGEQGAGGANA